MRVTLKDIKKRRSIQEAEDHYLANYQEETKDSLSRDFMSSLKKELMKSDGKDHTPDFKTEVSPQKATTDYRCCLHPDKKATHRLIN